jgi:predicted MFS family arabinose efflux permease
MFISELVFIMRDRFKNNDQDINDLASALYTMGWFVGEFAGPLLGAWLVPWVGFARTGGILAILMLVTDAVYVVIAIYDASTRK